MSKKMPLSRTLFSCLVCLFAGKAMAADGSNVDWPCVQRKVPKLSAGMMWAGPPIDSIVVDGNGDEKIRSLIERLAIRRTPIEEAEENIREFAKTLDKAEKTEKLTQVFAGLLRKANAERGDILRGIERFTRKQRQIVEGIQEKREELEAVLRIENPDEEDDKKRRAIEEQLNWQTRIHEDREKSLVYVCEIPVLLEQRLFGLARELANNIE